MWLHIQVSKKCIWTVRACRMRSGPSDRPGTRIIRMELMSACLPRDVFWLIVVVDWVVPRSQIFSFYDFTSWFQYFFPKTPRLFTHSPLFFKIISISFLIFFFLNLTNKNLILYIYFINLYKELNMNLYIY